MAKATRPVRQLRAHAARDRRAVRGRLDPRRAVPAGACRLSPARRRLLLRRSLDGGREGRARRRRHRRRQPGGPRAHADHQRRAPRRATPRGASTSRSRSSRARSCARSSSASTSTPSGHARRTRTASCGSSCRSPRPAEEPRQVPISEALGVERPSRSRSSRTVPSKSRSWRSRAPPRSRTRCRSCR